MRMTHPSLTILQDSNYHPAIKRISYLLQLQKKQQMILDQTAQYIMFDEKSKLLEANTEYYTLFREYKKFMTNLLKNIENKHIYIDDSKQMI